MRIKAPKPTFVEVDGEYVVPVRLSEDLVHNLVSGWWPMGFGWAQLRPRADNSYDLFIRGAQLSTDMNLVSLDLVQQAMMAAVDLAQIVLQGESLVDEATSSAARELLRLVSRAAG